MPSYAETEGDSRVLFFWQDCEVFFLFSRTRERGVDPKTHFAPLEGFSLSFICCNMSHESSKYGNHHRRAQHHRLSCELHRFFHEVHHQTLLRSPQLPQGVIVHRNILRKKRGEVGLLFQKNDEERILKTPSRADCEMTETQFFFSKKKTG